MYKFLIFKDMQLFTQGMMVEEKKIATQFYNEFVVPDDPSDLLDFDAPDPLPGDTFAKAAEQVVSQGLLTAPDALDRLLPWTEQEMDDEEYEEREKGEEEKEEEEEDKEENKEEEEEEEWQQWPAEDEEEEDGKRKRNKSEVRGDKKKLKKNV